MLSNFLYYLKKLRSLHCHDDDDCFCYNKYFSPLIEGLCSSDLISIRVVGFTFASFALLFQKKTYVEGKKAIRPDLIPPPSMYKHNCTLYTHTNTYMPRFGPSGLFGSSRCRVPTPGLTSSNPCAVCVCVHVYTHIRTHTLPPRVKNREDTRQCLYLANMYSDVKITCGMYKPACTGAQDTCLVLTTLTAKTHMHPREHVCATVQQLVSHRGNDCDPSCNLTST